MARCLSWEGECSARRHSVPKMPGSGPRINITFRQLMGAPGWRPPEWDAYPDLTEGSNVVCR